MVAFVSGGVLVVALEILWGLYVWQESRKQPDPWEWTGWGP